MERRRSLWQWVQGIGMKTETSLDCSSGGGGGRSYRRGNIPEKWVLEGAKSESESGSLCHSHKKYSKGWGAYSLILMEGVVRRSPAVACNSTELEDGSNLKVKMEE
uniref:Uncharacterized protein n=1 Tax=Manihot esculenta TaxID=3983 RepID=A0A2C9WA76_MANES